MKKTFFLAFLASHVALRGQVNQNTAAIADAHSALGKTEQQFFVENKGQWPREVLFLTRIGGLDAWITQKGMVHDFYKLKEKTSAGSQIHPPMPDKFSHKEYERYGHVIRWDFEEANTQATPVGKGKLSAYYNYFIGNDPAKWASYVGLYKEVSVKEVYPGIDARYYFEGKSIRYDFIVRACADVSQIKLTAEGAEAMWVDKKGDLQAKTRFGAAGQAKLFAYQMHGGEKREVACDFVVQGNEVSFKVGNYDRFKDLVIDPLLWSTFIGGTGYEEPRSIAHNNGDIYVAGYTQSTGYPTTSGAYDTSFNGSNDAFVTKVNSSGSGLSYSTFLGGSANDKGNAITVNVSGNAYLTGETSSSNYPTTQGAYDETYNANGDVFVTKLNSDGAGLGYSTFIGGEDGNDWGNSIALDGSGNAYVTGVTGSDDYPTTSGAYDTSYNDSNDVFVTKVNFTGSGLTYSTYIGGSSYEYGYSIALDPDNNAYITGTAASSNYPTSAGAFDTSHNGGQDGFVSKLDCCGAFLLYSTFLGGSGTDYGKGITVDVYGYAYVTGATNNGSFPTTSGAYDTSHNGGVDIFVTKVNSAGSGLSYSTFIGGSSYEIGYSIILDASVNAYLTGYTGSSGFPTTSGAYDTTQNGSDDAFISKLNSDGSSLDYSTFIGGTSIDRAYAITLDASGNASIAGITYSTTFPVTAGAYDETHNGSGDVFVTKLSFTVLPIELVDFYSTCNGSSVILHWATASELNNDFFSIERSTDGITFETIGKAEGAGASNEFRRYSFADHSPCACTAYYRLKQTDFDGAFEYSPLISARCQSFSGNLIIYPNPTTGILHLKSEDFPIDSYYLVYDVMGRPVQGGALQGSDSSISINAPAGVYQLQVKQGNRIMHAGVIKE